MVMDTNFMNRWLFTDEATFHGSGIMWGIENPMTPMSIKRHVPWLTFTIGGVTSDKVYGR
jgi:hypothetical protein